jgi:perosamine synthetase
MWSLLTDMRIGRTLPPAAAPIHFRDIMSGFAGFFGGNKAVERFNGELRSHYRVKHTFLVSSGKAALLLILQALHEISPDRDEVLIPAYTCYSVPSAIVRAGLKVRLCDIDPDTLDFDFGCLGEKLRNPRLLCVLPTHLFGLPADVDRVIKIAQPRGVFVVEDAAQAMGGERDGKKIGTLGDVGFFSMGRGKAFSTVEGGIVLTDHDLIAQAIAKRVTTVPEYKISACLKLIFYALALYFLIHPRIYWLPKSLPFLELGKTHFDPSFKIRKMSPFQAAMADGWQAKLASMKEVRSKNASRIANEISCPPVIYGDVTPGLIRLPIIVEDMDTRKEILEQSEKMGLGISEVYPDTIDGINDLGNHAIKGNFPQAKGIARKILTLPVHPYVKEKDIQKITVILKKWTIKE